MSFSVLGDLDDYLLLSGEAKPEKPVTTAPTISRRASKLPGIQSAVKHNEDSKSSLKSVSLLF